MTEPKQTAKPKKTAAVVPAGMKKKVGPLPVTGWVGVALGVVVVYVVYKRHQASKASTVPVAVTGTTDGQTQPVNSVSGSIGPPSFSSYEGWLQAAIQSATGSGLNYADSYNALTQWQNGGCVSAAAYSGISSALQSVGLPPGYSSNFPTLSVCPQAPSTPSTPDSPGPAPTTSGAGNGPPPIATSLMAAMTQNGETIADTAYDATTGTWLYLTNKGGVYAQSPTGSNAAPVYYGSYLGLPPGATKTNGAPRTFSTITTNSDGSYTLSATDGGTYTFGNQPGEAKTQ